MNKADIQKYPFIEGMRGLAALMVLGTHFCSAFFPAFLRMSNTTAHLPAEDFLAHTPAYALINGTVAVYIFFLMSGFVLTGAFLRAEISAPAQLCKRIIRLYVPVAASIVFATLLLSLFPSIRVRASLVTTSSWLPAIGSNPFTAMSIAKDLLLDSMLIGYKGSSVFDGLGWMPLVTAAKGINPPVWSIHYELWGSTLILLGAKAYQKLNSYFFWILFACTSWACGSSVLILFLCGMLLYIHRGRLMGTHGTVGNLLGVALIFFSIHLSISDNFDRFASLHFFLRRYGGMSAAAPESVQYEISALTAFLGVLISPILRSTVSRRVPVWLGRISFSLYLVHLPLLLTLACGVFMAVSAVLPYGLAVTVTALSYVGFTLAATLAFERFVDRPAVAVGRRLTMERPKPVYAASAR